MTLDMTAAETSLKISVADNNKGEGRDISNIQIDQGQLLSTTRSFFYSILNPIIEAKKPLIYLQILSKPD